MWKTVWWAITLSAMATRTSAVDPGYNGTIVDGYLKSLRAFLRQNDLDAIALPDFHWFENSFWNVVGTEGSLGNLSTVQWADGATVIQNGDVINILTSLYIPKAQIHYKITLFRSVDVTMDTDVITNALKVNVNFNQTDCSLKYNQINLEYFENVFPNVQLSFLGSRLVPKGYEDIVEGAIAVAIQVTNSVFNIVVKPILTTYITETLPTQTRKFNWCQIFVT